MKINGPGQSAALLLEIITILNKEKIPYAIVGAIAASFYGFIRASIDADVVISFQESERNLQALLEDLKAKELTITHRKGGMDDPVSAVINVEDSFHNRVDLIRGIKGMKEDVFGRAVTAHFMGSSIQMIALEDFLAMKIFAGSPKDINDVIGVLKVSKEKVNISLLKEVVSNYGREQTVKLEALLKEHY